MTPKIYLASGSRYRRELLARLNFDFDVESADIDESIHDNETPCANCTRLAHEKALKIAQKYPDAIVIGCDQVADLDGLAISKPGNHETAFKQLLAMRGKTIEFHTAVCVMRLATGECNAFHNLTQVEFRKLSNDEIERYLVTEKPYDCAGSAKSEGLGISLLKRINSTDPTALIGLPLIQLSETLRNMGIQLP